MVFTVAGIGERLTFQQFTTTGDAGTQNTKARFKAIRERTGAQPLTLLIRGTGSTERGMGKG